MADQSPQRAAEQTEHSPGVNKLSPGAVEVVLALALMFAVPQLEWMGFLAYGGSRFAS